MASDADCIFCKIVAGEVPADVVHRTDTTIAFRDLEPQAPTHVLVIPVRHYPDVAAVAAAEPELAADLLAAVGAIAKQEGLDDGYRTVFNTGALAHQTVLMQQQLSRDGVTPAALARFRTALGATLQALDG